MNILKLAKKLSQPGALDPDEVAEILDQFGLALEHSAVQPDAHAKAVATLTQHVAEGLKVYEFKLTAQGIPLRGLIVVGQPAQTGGA